MLKEDPEVRLLAEISERLQAEYDEKDTEEWVGSPLAWIKERPSRQRGAICERFVAEYFASKGSRVEKSPNRDADRVIDNCRVEIKSSTLWKNGAYKFQQIRDQEYDVVILLGISPFGAHCWAIPKSVVMNMWGKVGGLSSQHGGRAGTDTAWLTVNPARVRSWLCPFGGSLGEAVQSFRRISA